MADWQKDKRRLCTAKSALNPTLVSLLFQAFSYCEDIAKRGLEQLFYVSFSICSLIILFLPSDCLEQLANAF